MSKSINQSIQSICIDERVKNHWHRHKNKHKLHYSRCVWTIRKEWCFRVSISSLRLNLYLTRWSI